MEPDAPLRIIPPWCRALGGLLAAAAVAALVLLVRDAAGQDASLAGVVGLMARGVLHLCVATLAGYVAVTGMAPTHLWPLAGHSCWPLRAELWLTPDLQRYARQLCVRHPGLRECWLLDSGRRGEWWLLARAMPEVLDRVREDWQIRRKDVHLYLRDDRSETITLAWGRSVPGDFAAWDWENDGDTRAEFRCPVSGEVRLATRLWQGQQPGAEPELQSAG